MINEFTRKLSITKPGNFYLREALYRGFELEELPALRE
jgi:hypothetical protein